MQRFLRPRHRLVGRAAVARQRHAADRGGHGDRAGLGGDHLVADGGMEALGGQMHVGLVAVHQDDAELVAGVAADGVALAELRS